MTSTHFFLTLAKYKLDLNKTVFSVLDSKENGYNGTEPISF